MLKKHVIIFSINLNTIKSILLKKNNWNLQGFTNKP